MRIRHLKYKASCLVLVILLCIVAGCSDNPDDKVTEPLKGTLNNEGKPFKLKVVTYDSLHELQKAKQAADNARKKTKESGWAGWSLDGSYCEIHVLRLKHKNDTDEMETWGHELAHCIYGAYHEEET